MKYLLIVVIATLLGGGYAVPAKLKSVSSSGVVCKIDDDGNTVECSAENSQLPDDLDTDGAVASDDFACLDITYKTGVLLKKTHHVMQCAYQLKGQRLCTVLKNENDVSQCTDSVPDPKPDPVTTTQEPPSGLYCGVDDLDNTVECSKKNSVLPDDLDEGDYEKESEFVCLDVTYRTGLIPLLVSHHVRQCALKLVDEDLCDVLQDRNNVPSCAQSTPYSTPTIVPPSGLYCAVDSDGDKVECSKANSGLPSNLSIGSAEESDSYICLSVTYEIGIFPLKKTRSTQQCAYEVDGDKDLCSVLQDNNDIQKCRLYDPTEE